MKKIKDFLKEVEHEILMLKKHATKSEIEALNIEKFDYRRPTQCIYGQMTGNCESYRAKALMDKACIRVLHLAGYGVEDIDNVKISDDSFNINGEYTGQTWLSRSSQRRDYTYLSALEGYICTKNAKNKHIFEFLKDDSNTITLKL